LHNEVGNILLVEPTPAFYIRPKKEGLRKNGSEQIINKVQVRGIDPT
jgi:hypothetical protein